MFVLVDFDPHGVAIMRTYKYGSRRLEHEDGATAPGLRWLGILSDDIFPNMASAGSESQDVCRSQHSQESASQESVAYSYYGEYSVVCATKLRLTNLLVQAHRVLDSRRGSRPPRKGPRVNPCCPSRLGIGKRRSR